LLPVLYRLPKFLSDLLESQLIVPAKLVPAKAGSGKLEEVAGFLLRRNDGAESGNEWQEMVTVDLPHCSSRYQTDIISGNGYR